MLKGFRDFVLRGNVVDLAVAVVIGAAFSGVINSLVSDIINPLISAIVGKPNFGYLFAYLNGGKITYGNFINAVIQFIIIAAAIYFMVVMPLQRLLKKFFPAKAEPPKTRPCPQCLSDIPVEATRCAHCTQPVSAPAHA